MTAFDRFDPFEQRIADALGEIAPARRPDYLDDILGVTARTSQRPRWTFLERWLPMDTTLARTGRLIRRPLRPQLLLLLMVALLLAALAAAYVGSQRRVPSPFGPAGNGSLAYASNGDLFVRNALAAQGRLLIGGAGEDAFPFYSPDGRFLAFSTVVDGKEYLKVADADGSNVRQVLPDPLFNGFAGWAPDSARLAVVTDIDGAPTLLIVQIDTLVSRTIELGSDTPMDFGWRPPDGRQLLVRIRLLDGHVDLAIVDPATGAVQRLGLRSQLVFEAKWEVSGPAWAPDGSRIAYNQVESLPGSSPVGHFRVHLVNPDGSGDVALAGPADPAVQEAWPVYSPDGRWILVHRWTWKSNNGGEGWLAVMPADGSGAARDIGPRIPGGEDTGLSKLWSPDGSRVLMRAENTRQVYSIDPVSGVSELLPWTDNLPDWQRVAR